MLKISINFQTRRKRWYVNHSPCTNRDMVLLEFGSFVIQDLIRRNPSLAIGRANSVHTGVTRHCGALKSPVQLTCRRTVSGHGRRIGEKVRMWPRAFTRRYPDVWYNARYGDRDSTGSDRRAERRAGDSACRRRPEPSSANGITLTQWHSDYIIAGLSSSRLFSFTPRESSPGPLPGTSVCVVPSRSFASRLRTLFFRSARARLDSSIILGRQMTRPPKSNERQRGCRRARLVKHFVRVARCFREARTLLIPG